MSKDQLDQKRSREIPAENRPRGRQLQKGERNRPDRAPESEIDQSGRPGPQRDLGDDQGRQGHMGHGGERDEKAGRRPLEEKPERPGRDEQASSREGGQGRKAQAGQWDDKTEGTSREESDPAH
jgi:hypothetical protein